MRKFFLLIMTMIACFQAIHAQDVPKIDPVLQQEMGLRKRSELIPINIVLTAQYDEAEMRNKANVFQTKKAKRDFVIDELKQFSTETQSGLVQELNTLTVRSQVSDFQSFWIINMISCNVSVEVIEALATRSDIMIIGFNREQQLLPDDEMSTEAKQTREIAYNVLKVNSDDVWALGYTGEGIVIAVIDSGVNYDHTDLQGNMWEDPNYPNHGYDFINNDNDPKDDNGHGTHCAGTVAGNGASGTQTGMAPNAKIMAVKVLSNTGNGSLAASVSGIQFGVEHHADVLSMSFGFSGGGGSTERIALRNAMINVLSAGIVAAVAAGNDGEYITHGLPPPINVGLPGNCPPPWLNPDQTLTGGLTATVCVGATDRNDRAAYFTSQGPVTWQSTPGFNDYPYNPGMGLIRPDVCAPGVDVKSLTYNNNTGYTLKSGTSMATPGVAGVMALMLSKNPELTPAQVCELLERTAKPLSSGKSNIYGSGRVDALFAIDAMSMNYFQIESYTIDDSEGNNDGKMNPGETIHLSVTLKNNTAEALSDLQLLLRSYNEWITFQDNTESVGALASGASITLPNAFTFTLSENANGKISVAFILEAVSSTLSDHLLLSLMIYGSNLEYNHVTIENEDMISNLMLDPGEIADMVIFITNGGNISTTGVQGVLTSESPLLTINEATATYGNFNQDQTLSAAFNVTLSPDTEIGYVLPLKLTLTDDKEKVTEIFFDYRYPCVFSSVLSLEVVSQSSVRVSWEAMENVKSYTIYRNSEIFVEGYTKNTFINSGLNPDIQYCYEVSALCENGYESGFSNKVCRYSEDISELSESLKIYPNPANTTLFIEGENIESIFVYNVLGQLVEKIAGQGISNNINTSSYPATVYFLEVAMKNGEKVNRKVVISH